MDYNLAWKTITAQFLNTTFVVFIIKVGPIVGALNTEATVRTGKFDGRNIWGA